LWKFYALFRATLLHQKFLTKILVQNELKVFFKKEIDKLKQPNNLKKLLQLEYYISIHHNQFHLQIFNF